MTIKLKSLAEVLRESPVRMPGNAPFETLASQSISSNGIEDEYIKIADYTEFEVYKHNTIDYIVVGKFYHDEITKKERFGLVADLSFKEKIFRTKNKVLGNKNTIQIETIHVETSKRRRNIATFLYKYLLSQFHVMSDKVQYENAVKLWKQFIEETNSLVYLYDSKNDIIVTKVSKNTNPNMIWSDYPHFHNQKYQLIMISK